MGDVDRLRRSLVGTVRVEETFPLAVLGSRCGLRRCVFISGRRMRSYSCPCCFPDTPLPAPIESSILVFVTFGLVASATYMINDLMDLAADRAHPAKRERPFASGALSIRARLGRAAFSHSGGRGSFIAAPATILLDHRRVRRVHGRVFDALKEAPILDLIVPAFLFTLRLVGGMVAIEARAFPRGR